MNHLVIERGFDLSEIRSRFYLTVEVFNPLSALFWSRKVLWNFKADLLDFSGSLFVSGFFVLVLSKK